MNKFTLIQGENPEALKQLADNSVDSIVTDPPYELGFMGKKWDGTGIAYNVEMWAECLRVLKPGGHLLSFGGSRTYHRMACAIEDAGFEIRDQIMWVYGSGFPKSLSISKSLDKIAGAERDVLGSYEREGRSAGILGKKTQITRNITAPATPEAQQWDGWGTALKPAHEPICVARKPFTGTVAGNVLEWGTGGINIDGCRVGTDDNLNGGAYSTGKYDTTGKVLELGLKRQEGKFSQPTGRWPANFCHDGSDEVVGLFPDRKAGGNRTGNEPSNKTKNCYGEYGKDKFDSYADFGSAARFFYCAKASKRDRDEGCERMENVTPEEMTGRKQDSAGLLRLREDGTIGENPYSGKSAKAHNHHPTVKPTDLMRYLCRLVTPPDGIVLDPFCGSGSTGKAAILEGFSFIGIDQSAEYIEIAGNRIKFVLDKERDK